MGGDPSPGNRHAAAVDLSLSVPTSTARLSATADLTQLVTFQNKSEAAERLLHRYDSSGHAAVSDLFSQ